MVVSAIAVFRLVVLVPIIKDKTGRIDRIDNYRPIALASVVSREDIVRQDISLS